MRTTAKWFTVTAAAVALAAACDQNPTAVPMADEFEFAAVVDPGAVAAVTQVTVCKEGPAGTYNFTIVANTGNVSLPYGGSFTLTADECKTVAVQADLQGANLQSVTIAEVLPGPAGTLFDEVDVYPVGSVSGLGSPTTSTNPEVTAAPFGEDGGWVVVYKNINAPVTGCTLTQGYWKTHSEYGPAPYNNTWALLANGADEPFYLSGQTWYEVFWTAPKGNAYYNLAHQFEAAVLNVLAGASAPAAVVNAILEADGLFTTYTPAQIADLKGNDSLRQQFLSLAGTLADYNEGDIGPGHCE
jgi:hypothetical protein